LELKKYYFDAASDIIPFDIALGWGRVAKQENFERISVSKSFRWYMWRTKIKFMPLKEISQSSSNHHIIPSNTDIDNILLSADDSDIIAAKGDLVDIEKNGNIFQKSSLTINDTGDGACELFYVT
jgi:hypothetical protein